jgi:hypothetical protein
MLFSLESLVLKLEIHNPDFIKKHNLHDVGVYVNDIKNFIKNRFN